MIHPENARWIRELHLRLTDMWLNLDHEPSEDEDYWGGDALSGLDGMVLTIAEDA